MSTRHWPRRREHHQFGIRSIILGQRIDRTNVDPFRGTLDEFRVYGRAVTDDELYEIRTHNVPIAGQLRLRLPFTTINPQQ